MTLQRKKLIEVALPLEAINKVSVENSSSLLVRPYFWAAFTLQGEWK